MSPRVAVLVPVKALAHAKTRLAGAALTGAGLGREELMRAFARDVCTAARTAAAVQAVHVVTDAPEVLPGLDDAARPAAPLGWLPDEGEGDLNQALGRATLRLRAEDPAVSVAALCGDLPCLRPDDLDRALAVALDRVAITRTAPSDAAGTGRSFVPDAEGVGTTMLVAPPGVDLDPRFGPGSAHRHQESGAARIMTGVASLRRDVDTETDLRAALSLGVGAATSRLLAARGLRDLPGQGH